MEEKHRSILEKIKNSESEQSRMPTDHMSVNLQLSDNIEQCQEFLDDDQGLLARNPLGQLFRQKLKVTLSYRQAPGQIGAGIFKNVQIDLVGPGGVLMEKTKIVYESLTLSGSTTPPTEIINIYA